MNGLLDRAKDWAKRIKRDVVALWLAARDPRTPLIAKIVSGLVAAYALSPIDLIPDFVPVLGYLDDLLIVPLGILLAIRLVPHPLMCELREKADSLGGQTSRVGLAMVAGLWAFAAAMFTLWLWKALH